MFGPSSDVSVDSCPDKPGTQKLFCGQSAGVCDVVDAVENGAAVTQRYQRPPYPCGCVAGQFVAAYCLKRNGSCCWARDELLGLCTVFLLCCHFLKVNWVIFHGCCGRSCMVSGRRFGRSGQDIGNHVLRTWEVSKIRSEFGYGCQMSAVWPTRVLKYEKLRLPVVCGLSTAGSLTLLGYA